MVDDPAHKLLAVGGISARAQLVRVPHEVDIVCGHAEELAAAGCTHQVKEQAVALEAALQVLRVLYERDSSVLIRK